MGQYYHPIVLKREWENRYEDYNDEVSEQDAQFIADDTIEATLYSHDFDNGLKLMEHSYIGNGFVQAVMRMIDICDEFKEGVPFVWCGDYSDYSELYDLSNVKMDDKEWAKEWKNKVADADKYYTYVAAINHTKKQYVIFPEYEYDKWAIHPLPILTSSGNGRGCGDYDDDPKKHNSKFVGTWAFDDISVVTDIKDIPDGYEKVDWKTEYDY